MSGMQQVGHRISRRGAGDREVSCSTLNSRLVLNTAFNHNLWMPDLSYLVALSNLIRMQAAFKSFRCKKSHECAVGAERLN